MRGNRRSALFLVRSLARRCLHRGVLRRVIRTHFPEGRVEFPHLRFLVAPVRVIAADQRCPFDRDFPNFRPAVRAVPTVRHVFQRGHMALQEWIFGVLSERFFEFVDHSVFGRLEEAEQGHCWQPLPAAKFYFESESSFAGWVARVLSFDLIFMRITAHNHPPVSFGKQVRLERVRQTRKVFRRDVRVAVFVHACLRYPELGECLRNLDGEWMLRRPAFGAHGLDGWIVGRVPGSGPPAR